MSGLVLSGGGAYCAFQAGVVKSMFARDPSKKKDIKKIYGVSGGALNGAYLAQEMDEIGLARLWQGITGAHDVIHVPIMGKLRLAYRTGIGKTHILERLIRDNLDYRKILYSGISIHFGVYNCQKMQYEAVTEATPDLWKWVLASSVFPFAFETVEIDGTVYTDGGVVTTTPLLPAVRDGCEEIDVIITFPLPVRRQPIPREKMKNGLHLGLSLLTGMMDEIFLDDLRSCHNKNKKVENEVGSEYRAVKINVYAPRDPFSSDPLDFSPNNLWHYFTEGERTEPIPLEEYLKLSG